MLRKIQLRRIPLALVRAVLYIPQGFLEIMIKVSMQIMQWLITFLANLEWMTDYNKALAEAKKLNTTVVAAFVSVHCGPCKFLKHEVFKTVRFGWWVLNNNLVLLEVESTPANDSLMKKYGVTGVPDVLGLNADGTERGRVGGYSQGTGPDQWIAKFEQATGMNLTPLAESPATEVSEVSESVFAST